MSLLAAGVTMLERGLVPDVVARAAIRRLCAQRLRDTQAAGPSGTAPPAMLLEAMRSGPVALAPEVANEQHYELPPDFFTTVLGPHRKYSCCYWPDATTTLEQAEANALDITCQRAELADGQAILELGCGWGSLSLWIAENYPHSHVTAVSNSHAQRRFIETEASARNIANLRVITSDMNRFDQLTGEGAQDGFDRVVSVEMFEHMRNYEQLLARIASWLRPDGKLFVHLFCHRSLAYAFETEGTANWKGRHFFTGGLMPSANLLDHFDRHLTISNRWTWNGRHYQRTAAAWLDNLDRHRAQVIDILRHTYGRHAATRWLNRWRTFFLAVGELFGYADGEEWFVAHYLMNPVHSVAACRR